MNDHACNISGARTCARPTERPVIVTHNIVYNGLHVDVHVLLMKFGTTVVVVTRFVCDI